VQAVSGLGDRALPIALAFAVLELGGSATEVGLVLTARIAPMTATLLVGGVVADRVARQRVMIAADVSRLLTQGLLAGLLIAGVAELWTLVVLAGLTGAAGGFFSPRRRGCCPRSSQPSACRRPTACGRRSFRRERSQAPRWRVC
jgi:MFS family permease